MQTEQEQSAEDYRKAAEHHAGACNFTAALAYLELYFALASDDGEEGEGE